MSSSKWKLHILGSTLITSMIATTVNNLTGLTYKSLKMEKSKIYGWNGNRTSDLWSYIYLYKFKMTVSEVHSNHVHT